MTISNPTRRKGPRTGAIPVPSRLIDKILKTIWSSNNVRFAFGKPRRMADGRFHPFDVVRFMPRNQFGGSRVYWDLSFDFRVQSYATGKREHLRVVVTDPKRSMFKYESGVSGMQESEGGPIVELPRPKRVALAKDTLKRLGVKPTRSVIKTLLDSAFALYGERPNERVALVTLTVPFDEPLSLRAVDDQFRSTLIHEIAHVMDEGLRLSQLRSKKAFEEEEAAGIDALMLLEEATEVLGLPMPDQDQEKRPVPKGPRREKEVFVPTADYYNLPHEVTARLPEIFDELDRHAADAIRQTSTVVPGTSRGQVVLSVLRAWSPTFRTASKHWSDKSLKRVLRAVYDRFHNEPWFPKATGVYKNRHTSRRRTSRRRRS